MKEFIAIDFETANPQRVSACALGYAKISNCEVVETKGLLIKPVGGHAPFQSKIHGIKEEHTHDKPYFGELFPQIRGIFDYPLVAHSLFDKQVLTALSEHFDLGLKFDYTDSCSIAKDMLPGFKDTKLKTLVKHFGLPSFKHHDAREDALAYAQVFLKLRGMDRGNVVSISNNDLSEFKGLLTGILADQVVNYKEAYELLYWLEDHSDISNSHPNLHRKMREVLSDDHLDDIEATEIKMFLENTLKELE
jgi:DNA polymerase-3 subunit epsilon